MSVTVEATGVHKAYRDGERLVEVLRGVDLEIAAGEMIAVVGPSGSGKSTLLHLLGGLDRPDQGSIRVAGREIGALDATERAAFRLVTVGFVFQFHQLLPDFTAEENVAVPGRLAGWGAGAALRRARSLLDEVGLADRATHFPNAMSGGERQRTALCRALFLDPPLLLADEPTGNLDPENGQRVFELLLELQARHRTTTVLVTHHPGLARRCGRLLRLDCGVVRTLSHDVA